MIADATTARCRIQNTFWKYLEQDTGLTRSKTFRKLFLLSPRCPLVYKVSDVSSATVLYVTDIPNALSPRFDVAILRGHNNEDVISYILVDITERAILVWLNEINIAQSLRFVHVNDSTVVGQPDVVVSITSGNDHVSMHHGVFPTQGAVLGHASSMFVCYNADYEWRVRYDELSERTQRYILNIVRNHTANDFVTVQERARVANSLVAVAEHEFGHWFGFKHVWMRRLSVMFTFYTGPLGFNIDASSKNDTSPRSSLTSFDRARVKRIVRHIHTLKRVTRVLGTIVLRNKYFDLLRNIKAFNAFAEAARRGYIARITSLKKRNDRSVVR